MPDGLIAAFLNRAGKTTGRDNNWNRSRVCMLRNRLQIPPYREGERTERGEITLDEAAAKLGVSEATAHRLIGAKVLAAHQPCKGAPWVIRAVDVEDPRMVSIAAARRHRRPPSADPLQNTLLLQ